MTCSKSTLPLSTLTMIALAVSGCGGSSSSSVSSTPQASVSEDSPAARRSASQLQTKPGWESILIDPSDEYVYPTDITPEGSGISATDPDALKAADGRCTTLTNTAGQNNARLVVDFGINAGGRIEVGLCDGTTSIVHLAYSERREWLNNDGDYSGDNIGQDDDELESRAYDIPAGSRGVAKVPSIQGAQRWISISMPGTGRAALDYIRIKPTHLRVSSPTEKGYGYSGRFLSSDSLLNTIWAQSAYTMSLVALKDPQRDRFVYVDGAKRDRMVWLGDVGNQGLSAYYSHKDGRKIMRDTLGMFACQQYPSGYLPMFSQISVACKDDFSDLAPDGPVFQKFEPLEEFGRLGEYTAWWVIGLGDYYLFSGDEEFVKALLPVARRTVNYFESHSNRGLYCTGQISSDTPSPTLVNALGSIGPILTGMLNNFSLLGKTTSACAPANVFEINWHPFDIAGGEDMHTNAVIYRAYKSLASLEQRLGNPAEAERITKLAEERKQAMLRTLWDSNVGAFKVNTLNPLPNHTQDGNVEALLGGIVSGDDAQRVLRFMDEKLQGPYGTLSGEIDGDPFMQQLYATFVGSRELVARLQLHDTAGALNQLRRLWGHMTRSDPASTVWERVSKTGDIPAYNLRPEVAVPSPTRPAAGFTSAAHGWGTGPLNALTGFIVGIRPVKPGFSTWVVEPQPGDLAWAQGQVDTPSGLLAARWSRESGGFHLTVSSPSKTSGTVAVPLMGQSRVIFRDGKLVWSNNAPVGKTAAVRRGDYVEFANVVDTATFAW